MWRSPNRRIDEDRRINESKTSQSNKFPYKPSDNNPRTRDYNDSNYSHNLNFNFNTKHYNSDKHLKRDNYNNKSDNYNKLDNYNKSDNYNKLDNYNEKHLKRDNYGKLDNYKRDGYKSEKRRYYQDHESSRKKSHKYSSHSHSSREKKSEVGASKRQESIVNEEINSPRTPLSEIRSPSKKFSPPPLPPFEPPTNTRNLNDSKFQNKPKLEKTDKQEKNETVITFVQYYENKMNEGKYKEFGPDPRLTDQLYGSKLVTKFEIPVLNTSGSLDNTLDSPTFSLNVKYDSVYTFYQFFKTPLERINDSLLSPRPKINDEWWLKGSLVLMLIGIPRNWTANQVLSHLISSHYKLTNSQQILCDEYESDSEGDDVSRLELKSTFKKDCKSLGIKKFFFLFGNPSNAVNEIPSHFPASPNVEETKKSVSNDVQEGKKFIPNDVPEGMGLIVFETEDQALKFWSILGTALIQAYPSTMRLCPDPSGWRIYSEAIAYTFTHELLNAPPTVNRVKNDTIDLLSVLTTNPSPPYNSNSPVNSSNNPNTVSNSGNNAKSRGMLIYVSAYIYNQDEANMVAKSLGEFGVKCMYHKPSKIMSLQFPDEKTFQNLSFGHKLFTTPTGSRVQCCFLRYKGKALPILKRANLEHLSNMYDPKKNTQLKPLKFKPPSQGILNLD
uniref:Uncharacterized protein n=1 Tax=Theileria annulata TaxID=5874 RepID=A0A3B0MM61_THEAN